MTVAHKDLTGTDLHEVKGASTATAGLVPVADGAGGAPFGKLTAASLTGTGNSFGSQLLHIREEQNAGVSSVIGGASNTWLSVPFNITKVNEITGAVPSGSAFSLPAGTYYIEATVPMYVSATNSTLVLAQARLLNASLGTTILSGQTTGLFLSTNVNTVQGNVIPSLRGRFTLSGTTVLALQGYSSNTAGSTARGLGASVEVYGEALIWKIA